MVSLPRKINDTGFDTIFTRLSRMDLLRYRGALAQPAGKSGDKTGVKEVHHKEIRSWKTSTFDLPPDKWDAGGAFLFRSFAWLIYLSIFAGMIRFAKVSFLTLCFLFLLTHAWETLVQVDRVSSPAGHVNDSRVVESGSLFQTMQPTLNSSGYISDTGRREMNGSQMLVGVPSPRIKPFQSRLNHPHGSLFSFHRRHGRRRGDHGLV